MKQLKNRQLRYSSLSVVFTVAVLAALIVLNVVFTSLANRNGWFADMTSNDLFSVSDATIDRLRDLEGNYEILFCRPLDQVESDSQSRLIYNCAKEFAAKMDNVTIDYLDIVTYPSLANLYKRSISESIYTTDVIVRNVDEKGECINFKKYGQSDFYVINSDSGAATAFRGEQRFSNAFLQLGGEHNPVALFTSGHGEKVPAAFRALFEDVGYDVQSVDLTKEEIPENTRVIVIFDPTADFNGANEEGVTNEIEVIDDYMDRYGNLMVFMGGNTVRKEQSFPELAEYLEEWGIVYGEATVKDTASSTSPDGSSIIAALAQGDTLGASVTKDLQALDSQPITLVNNARPLYQPASDKNSRTVSGVLTSSPSAVSVDINGDQTTGQVDLMLLSREQTVTDDGNLNAYVLACGSADFCNDNYLSKNAYGNRDIIYSLLNIFNKDQQVVSIDYKEYDASALTVSTVQARGWLIGLSVVLPVLIFAMGLVVWIRRKRL